MFDSWRDIAAVYVPAPPVPDVADYEETLEHAGERIAQDGLIAESEWAEATDD